MGSINITVPGDINLEYKIENNEVVEKIIPIMPPGTSSWMKKPTRIIFKTLN